MKRFALFLFVAAALSTASFAQTARVKYISTSTDEINTEALQQEQPVELTRILMAGYNSICLPLSLTAEQLQAAAPGVRVERLAVMKQEGSAVCLYFIDCTADGIEAGIPYLIYSPKTQILRAKTTNAAAVDTELKDITLSDKAGNRVTFNSSWKSLKTFGRFGIPAKQDKEVLESILIRTDGEQTFLPTRCGFSWEAQAPTASELQIKHARALDEVVTDVEELKAANALVDIYDANGLPVRKNVNINQALKTLPRGIYYVGNEKFMVK